MTTEAQREKLARFYLLRRARSTKIALRFRNVCSRAFRGRTISDPAHETL
jgi:hypothetical protein